MNELVVLATYRIHDSTVSETQNHNELKLAYPRPVLAVRPYMCRWTW